MNCKIKMQFDPEIAKEIGVEEAIMLSNIEFWCEHNKANNKNKYDGFYWTYNSMKAFEALFTFWSKRQIERILKNLKNKKYIRIGNYNKHKYDRTIWYSPISPNTEMEITKHGNGNNQTRQPIPDNKPDNKPDKSILEKFNFFWDLYQKKIDKHKCELKWSKLKNEDREAVVKNVPLYIQANPDIKYRKNPLTYLNGRCWEDEIISNSKCIDYDAMGLTDYNKK